ncbi:amidohydrolase [Imperialibacter roseus]|uniref:Amidohydrolase n=1 Tax=Imperialibacter roseus TaxID=1324217 RepID=A0ABZ0IY78_9BACT|nr:amidohydrolase [Imperialibacter roseus]WOK09338.1 amidohydrolase [Imperialibacter roseus]
MKEQEIKLLTSFRRELHRYPELSGEENETAKKVLSFLERTNPSAIHAGIGGNGLVAIYDSGQPGPSIGFRCELDALPIVERNSFDHKSENTGTSHKCGHDGHMAIVAGVGLYCKENPVRRGKLTLIFQPAEETGCGAQSMLNDPILKSFLPKQLFALHNVPGFETGAVICKKDVACPASEGLVFSLEGKTSHAGQPEKGNNPAPVMAAIQLKAQQLHDERWQNQNRTKITTVMMDLGGRAFGVNPGKGSVAFTLRSDSNEELAVVKSELIKFAKEKCEMAGLALSLEESDPFKAVVNDPEAFTAIQWAAVAKGLAFEVAETPFPWSEDFGRFSEVTSTGFFGLGAGLASPELHHDIYDFPDELIPIGTGLFLELGKALWA